MKAKTAIFSLLLFAASFCAAQDYSAYDGFTISAVEVQTNRIRPEILKKRFPLKAGQTFSEEAFEQAQNTLHDLRIAKKLSFEAYPESEQKLNIKIKAEDGYYIFPLAFYTGGKKSAAGGSLAAGNLFKRGETLMLFGGSGKDGTLAALFLKDGENIFQASFKNMNFEQRFYSGARINNDGVFSTTDDEEDFKNPIAEIYTKKDSFSLAYARKLGDFTAFVMPEYKYVLYSGGFSSGNYSTINFGINYKKNIRGGANMGALFGYGLTDKQQALRNLPKPVFGYALQTAYRSGAKITGADFNISKLSAMAQTSLEFKTRHTLNFYFKAEDAFSSPFEEQVRSKDLTSGLGRYSRAIYGGRGAGAAVSFAYYLARNNTGLFAFQPFCESVYVYNGGYKNLSGAGATLSYKFWRFPFPLGLNYTHNLSDGSSQISFSLGGVF